METTPSEGAAVSVIHTETTDAAGSGFSSQAKGRRSTTPACFFTPTESGMKNQRSAQESHPST